jgi:hypothetical protein
LPGTAAAFTPSWSPRLRFRVPLHLLFLLLVDALQPQQASRAGNLQRAAASRRMQNNGTFSAANFCQRVSGLGFGTGWERGRWVVGAGRGMMSPSAVVCEQESRDVVRRWRLMRSSFAGKPPLAAHKWHRSRAEHCHASGAPALSRLSTWPRPGRRSRTRSNVPNHTWQPR